MTMRARNSGERHMVHAEIVFRFRGLRHAAGIASLFLLSFCGGFCAMVLSVGWHDSVLVSPPSTPIIEDRAGNYLTEGDRSSGAVGYWDAHVNPDSRIALCLTMIEDRRFWEHPGVDLRSLGRAIVGNISGESYQGASTIAMQVARLQTDRARTPVNKIFEMSTALFLTLKYGREAVLDHYIKIVPQGNQIFGAAYAARRFFRKPLEDISLAEAAVLASLPKAPGRMNLFRQDGLEAAKQRAMLILRLLFKNERIGAEDYEAALRQLSYMSTLRKEDRPATAYHYILRTLEEERKNHEQDYSAALRASLDPDVQRIAQTVAESAVADNLRHDARNIAIIVAHKQSGDVLAYVGSTSYFDADTNGAINYAATPRSSGSALKPFLFARGIDTRDFNPGSIVADLPFAVLSAKGEYRAANFDDEYLGPMLYRRALGNSRNTPALRVLETVGMEDYYDLVLRLGLVGDDRGPDYYGYGVAIGGLYVTLESLVSAYGTLANDGRAYALSWFRTGDGELRNPSERFFSTYAARVVTHFLSDNEARYPSFPRLSILEYPFPVALKTGTSQGYRDAWTVAWTDKYIVGIWMGNPDNKPMNRVAGVVSAVYVNRILTELHPLQTQGIDIHPFARPDGAIPVKICVLSGKRAGPNCSETSTEWFRSDEVPRDICSVHQPFAIDTGTGGIATADTPASRVAIRTFAVLPPEFAVWGARQGYGPPARQETASTLRPELRITRPNDGGRYLFDPGMPADFQTIPLEVTVQPSVPEILWYVDGRLFARVGFPYSTRLPLSAGTHRISVGLPDQSTIAGEVRIEVE